MARRGKPAAEVYHDRVAGIYDTIYDGDSYWEAVFDLTWRNITRHLPRDLGTRCLDIGCGTGRWGLKLMRSGYRVDFLDISGKMLDQVAKKLSALGIPWRVAEAMPGSLGPIPPLSQGVSTLWHATVDDVSALPAGTYGFLVGQGDPLCAAEKPERAMKGLTKLLAPGGVMVMSVDNRLQGIYHFLKEGDVAGLERFLRTGKTEWVTDEAAERYPLTMFTPEGIRGMCRTRGLTLLGLIGKTVLPLRRFKALLSDPAKREALLRLEESWHGEEAMLANAAHLDFAARAGVDAESDCGSR